jgi:hypothetical protein
MLNNNKLTLHYISIIHLQFILKETFISTMKKRIQAPGKRTKVPYFGTLFGDTFQSYQTVFGPKILDRTGLSLTGLLGPKTERTGPTHPTMTFLEHFIVPKIIWCVFEVFGYFRDVFRMNFFNREEMNCDKPVPFVGTTLTQYVLYIYFLFIIFFGSGKKILIIIPNHFYISFF